MLTRMTKGNTLLDVAAGATQVGYTPLITPNPNNVPGDTINAARVSAGILRGIEIDGGALFTDTLGSFYPVTINAPNTTTGLTINGSYNFPTTLQFHNTATSAADVNLYPATFTTSATPANATAVEYFPTGGVMSRWATIIYDYNELGDGHYFFIQPSSNGYQNAPAIQVSERLNSEAHASFRNRYFAGMLFGGVDNTGDSLPILVRTTAGAPADADVFSKYYGSATNGAIAVDTTNSRFYVRIGGTWKYAALT